MLVVVGEDGDAEVAVLSEQRGPLQLGAHGHGVTVMGDCAGAGAASSAVSLLLLPSAGPPPPPCTVTRPGVEQPHQGGFSPGVSPPPIPHLCSTPILLQYCLLFLNYSMV